MIDLAFGLYMAEAEGYDLSTGEKINEEPEDNINWDEFCEYSEIVNRIFITTIIR